MITSRQRYEIEEAIERYADAIRFKEHMETPESVALAEKSCERAWGVIQRHLNFLETDEHPQDPATLDFFGDVEVRALI